jgi:hypothetical protein
MIDKDLILQIVCTILKINKDLVLQNNATEGARKAELVQARFWSMYFFKKYTNDTFQQIGEYFNRDHASAMYGISKTEEQIEVYPAMKIIGSTIELAIIEAKIAMAEGLLKARLQILLDGFITEAKKITSDLLNEK